MRAAFLTFLVIAPVAQAGSVETFDGVKTVGAITLDFGQIIVTPNGGAAVKIDPAEVLSAQFADSVPAESFAPGVLLRNGTRLTGPFTTLTEPVVKFDRYKLSLPGGEIAWVIYQPIFPAVAASAPVG